MYRALSDNFAIARVLARLRHNEEEIPVDEEDLQALAYMHERVNMNLALCGSLFSRYRNASIGATDELFAQSKQLAEIVDGQLGEIEQVLKQALAEVRRTGPRADRIVALCEAGGIPIDPRRLRRNLEDWPEGQLPKAGSPGELEHYRELVSDQYAGQGVRQAHAYSCRSVSWITRLPKASQRLLQRPVGWRFTHRRSGHGRGMGVGGKGRRRTQGMVPFGIITGPLCLLRSNLALRRRWDHQSSSVDRRDTHGSAFITDDPARDIWPGTG